MKVRVLRLDGGRCAWADAAVADYQRRLPRGLPVTEEALPTEPVRGDPEPARLAEGVRLLKRVGRARLVVLDERGAQLDTPGFARLLEEGRRDGDLVFALGGPYGHGQPVRDAAWRAVALSALVLNHEVARVVLWEQIYRASSLLTGSPYHHG